MLPAPSTLVRESIAFALSFEWVLPAPLYLVLRGAKLMVRVLVFRLLGFLGLSLSVLVLDMLSLAVAVD